MRIQLRFPVCPDGPEGPGVEPAQPVTNRWSYLKKHVPKKYVSFNLVAQHDIILMFAP
jgi:hypothetical protein